jgi:hypothetical protein
VLAEIENLLKQLASEEPAKYTLIALETNEAPDNVPDPVLETDEAPSDTPAPESTLRTRTQSPIQKSSLG